MRVAIWLFCALLFCGATVLGQDYTGHWTVSPCVGYSCDAFGITVVQFATCSVLVTDQSPQISIVPGGGIGGSLTGTFTTATAFTVSEVEPGGCTITYQLNGEFTSDTTFSGTFTVTFQGGECEFSNCTNQSWQIGGSRPKPHCCLVSTGNVDCTVGDGVDVGDLTALIDNLFINFTPLCCDGEANCDGVGGVDVGDLTSLIDNLFINFTPLPVCQ